MSDEACTYGRCSDRAVVSVTGAIWAHEARCHYHMQLATGGRRTPNGFKDGSVRITGRRLPTKDNVVMPPSYRSRVISWLTTKVTA